MNDKSTVVISSLICSGALLTFSIPLLLGMGWTFSIALALTVSAGVSALTGLGIGIFG